MPCGKPSEPLVRGTAYGCWTVMRQSSPDSRGRERWAVRATCCGREDVMSRDNVLRSVPACTKCCRKLVAQKSAKVG